MTTTGVRRRKKSERAAESETSRVTTDRNVLLDRLRTELEDLSRQMQDLNHRVHKMASMIEWEAPRTGPPPREEVIILRHIIASLTDETPSYPRTAAGAEYESIIRAAEEHEIRPARADTWLKKWAAEGLVRSPVKNRYVLMKPTRWSSRAEAGGGSSGSPSGPGSASSGSGRRRGGPAAPVRVGGSVRPPGPSPS